MLPAWRLYTCTCRLLRDWGDFIFLWCVNLKSFLFVACDGSIYHDAWWDHLICLIDTQIPIFKMRVFALDAGRDLWCFFVFFLWCDQYPSLLLHVYQTYTSMRGAMVCNHPHLQIHLTSLRHYAVPNTPALCMSPLHVHLFNPFIPALYPLALFSVRRRPADCLQCTASISLRPIYGQEALWWLVIRLS